jgi:hypothetical protein
MRLLDLSVALSVVPSQSRTGMIRLGTAEKMRDRLSLRTYVLAYAHTHDLDLYALSADTQKSRCQSANTSANLTLASAKRLQ